MKNLKTKLTTGLSIAMLGLGMLCPTYSQQMPLTTVTEQIVEQEMQTISGKVCKFEGARGLEADEKTGTILTWVAMELKDGTEMRCYAPKNYQEEGSFYRFYEAAKRYAANHEGLVEATITGYPLTEKILKNQNATNTTRIKMA